MRLAPNAFDEFFLAELCARSDALEADRLDDALDDAVIVHRARRGLDALFSSLRPSSRLSHDFHTRATSQGA